MKKLKVLTVIGTRPEIIRLSRVIVALDKYCNHILVHTGQNYDYELNKVFFDDLCLRKPNYFLNSTLKSLSASNTIGNIISNIDQVIEKEEPEALLVLGDTNSCLSVIPAKRRQIPIFHMEAGNRCFDQRVPEEVNRLIVDHIADINLTYSSIAREYLIKENIPSDRIIKIGSPMLEVISYYLPSIKKSLILKKLNLSKQKYFLVSTHREENIEPEISFKKIVLMLNYLAEEYNLQVIVSTHPRTKKRIDKKTNKFHPKIKFLKPLGFHDYIHLQMNATAVLSDSGTITEESSILNFPALNIREAQERPEGMEETSVMMIGLEVERIRQGLKILQNQYRDNNRNLKLVADYNVTNISDKVIRIIHSYTDYVNRVVWKKY